MAQAEPIRTPLEEKAAGAVLGALKKLNKKKFSLVKKKLKDREGGNERLPERSLQCANRTELADLIIQHYEAHYGVELLQQVLGDVGEQERSRELGEYLEQEGTSFRSWWKWKSRFPHLSPHDLSQAGFYYVGPGDRVRCFSCGGELENWQPGDVPLTRHQQSFPDCPYVRGKMGIDAGIVGPMQKLSLKDQPVPPEMAEEWGRLGTYRSGPWYPGEEPKPGQSGIKMNPHPVGGVDPQLQQKKESFSAAGVGPSVYEPQGPLTGGGIQHQGPIPGGNILFPMRLVETFYSGRTEGGIYNQEPFPGSEIIFPVGITVTVQQLVTIQPGPTVGVVDPQVQTIKGSSTGQEKRSSAMEGGATEVQKVSSINWLRGSTVKCELCGEIPLILHFSAPMYGRTFRAHLPWKGLFRCAETGIQFLVNTPAVIDFELVSWANYLKYLQENRLETVGPLFNINVLLGQVSAVYLPHYVCLSGRDVDLKKFKIVHYKSNGMTLESPSKTEPFYVTLENPTFSFIGVVYKVASLFRTKIPAHGVVLIYGRFIKGYTIHLYFLPQDPSIKQIVHKKETDNGFFWLDKPPLTRTVYTQRKYVVQGPNNAKIQPEDLKLRFDAKPELYNYSEIYLPEVNEEEIKLRVTTERDEKSVWCAVLRKEELMSGQQTAAGGQHFVDKHRTELIDRISNIDPVLDELLGHQILTQEQYDTVRSNITCQKRMRQLYDYVKAWGNYQKDVFVTFIQQHNHSLIRDLKNK
ncbi:uncharacterized protein LOC108703938 [Xenopus laevis]|uniref:Uncharacterized protein LOC108703938 n=1 Tax=Xenopus laevis TaxID=8355 RepID=A0A8J0U2Y2_XENLA|nr:uncharacterized protein LOC108703938 [Xenopus laevis]OCT59021.1 hypothetical protein XELAEV_18001511mg [Xenopus laevis]